MNGKELFELLNDFDDKIVKEAGEKLILWREAQRGEVVRADGSRRFPWRAVIASVVCTAAALFGVFVLLLYIGKIGIVNNPASTISEPDSSFDSQSTVMPDVFFEEAAYAYEEEDFEELKRYKPGDKLGENVRIASAKTTYKISDGTPVMQKQEVVLYGSVYLEKDLWYCESDGTTFINPRIYRMNELGLPSFAKDFEIKPVYCALTDKNTHGEGSFVHITLIEPGITVDYESKSITIDPQYVSVDFFETAV